ncbi:sugar ABC transporter substrate-binding protein [Rhizobium leguminosarum]|uniref:sugar ABC transporter substrate-binding protein n=1 Tax=Rhizobium TaxID=379 RepID=UPI001C969C1C|nr:sugar ABC transporter substrate-binding protein [Rhizobium leguminosarum]MBY5392863.1 sugar ABC transporter substrate-binding protein [Rhizobium leguminosarum]MBY5434469.1 sugar ABC transporter substrate-binding protein [Rhizobium leguminosarum]
MRNRTGFLTVLGLSTALMSVGPGAYAKDVTLAFVVTNFQNVAEVSQADGFKAEGEKLGAKVVLMDSKGSVEKQSNAIDDAIAQKVDGIAAIVLDSAVAKTWVDKANAAGIPFTAVLVQVGEPNAKWTDVYPGLASLVGRDDFQTGEDLAGFAAKQLPTDRTAKIGIVEGMAGYSTVVNLTNGFKAGLEKAGAKYEIVSSQPTDWTQAKGQEVCQNALVANPDIDVFYAHAETMAVGCADAISDAGSKAKVVTAAGGLAAGMPYVKSGQITASVCELWREYGAAGADTLYKAATDAKTPKGALVSIPPPIYTAENADSCKPQW